MYGLSIIYWRNQRYMLMCTRLMERFNLVRSSELLFSWWHVRELFRLRSRQRGAMGRLCVRIQWCECRQCALVSQ
jgi:hypothetical protein